MQGHLGGASARSLTQDPRAVLTPGEVFGPRLPPWIEELGHLPRGEIQGVGADPLEGIAQPAGQPQVGLVVAATRRFGDDMLDLQDAEDVFLLALAVPAAVPCLGPDARS